MIFTCNACGFDGVRLGEMCPKCGGGVFSARTPAEANAFISGVPLTSDEPVTRLERIVCALLQGGKFNATGPQEFVAHLIGSAYAIQNAMDSASETKPLSLRSSDNRTNLRTFVDSVWLQQQIEECLNRFTDLTGADEDRRLAKQITDDLYGK